MLSNSRHCGCVGSCTCYLPNVATNPRPAAPPRMDPNIIAPLLVQSVACGNSDLAAHLTKLAPIVIRRNGFCSDELFYISAQLELVDAAMMFARSYIDRADSKSQSKGFQQARSRSTSQSKAQSTTQNQSCGYSVAYSENQFNRESYDRARSQSTTDSNSEGFSDSNTYDRSLQQANGISQVWDTSRSESDGEGQGQHDEFTTSSGISYTKTNETMPGSLVNDISSGNAALSNISKLLGDIFNAFWSVESVGLYDSPGAIGGQGDFNFGGFQAPTIGGPIDITQLITDTVDDGYNDPGATQITSNNIPDLICCCDNLIGLIDCDPLSVERECHWDNEEVLQTIGQRYNVSYKITVGLDVIKKGLSASLSWARGGSWNQSHIVTKACTSSQSNSDTSNFYNQNDWSRAHGESLTHDTSSTQRDYHVRADSERTAHSRTDAGSANTGDAEAKSESGAERQSHNEAHGASQGTSWSKGRGRSNSLTTSDSRSDSIAENLSDIFTALSKLYDILFEQKMIYRSRFRAQQSAAIGVLESCKYAIPSDPVTSAMLRSINSCWTDISQKSMV